MTLVQTGPGKLRASGDDRQGFSGSLYNFDVDGHLLKQEHQGYLRTTIVPLLRAGGSIRLLGLTSRTGTAAYNRALSERRLASVLTFLRQEAGARFQVVAQIAMGEDAAADAGVPDDTEHERWRAVTFIAWSRPVPPPPHRLHTTPLVRRPTSRVFIVDVKANLTKGEPGSTFGRLGDRLAMHVYGRHAMHEAPGTSRLVPSSYELTAIMYRREMHSAGAGSATIDTWVVSYTWGPPAAFVQLTAGRWIGGLFPAQVETQSRVGHEEARIWLEDPRSILKNDDKRPDQLLFPPDAKWTKPHAR